MKRKRSLSVIGGMGFAVVLSAQVAVTNQGYVPFSEEPIHYRSPVNDPVAKLQEKLNSRDRAAL